MSALIGGNICASTFWSISWFDFVVSSEFEVMRSYGGGKAAEMVVMYVDSDVFQQDCWKCCK
jgi:hypothetical protein